MNGGSLSVQPCSTPRVYTVFAFQREQPGVVRLAGTDFCLDAGTGKQYLPESPNSRVNGTSSLYFPRLQVSTNVSPSSVVALRIMTGFSCLYSIVVKIWTCYPNVPQQQWFYTADNHLAIYNGPGKCATYAGGGCTRIYCFPGLVSVSLEAPSINICHLELR